MKFYVYKAGKNGEHLPTDNHYIVVNLDEPYAEKVFWLIKEHQKTKGTDDMPDTFQAFVKRIQLEAVLYKLVYKLSPYMDSGEAQTWVDSFLSVFDPMLLAKKEKNEPKLTGETNEL